MLNIQIIHLYLTNIRYSIEISMYILCIKEIDTLEVISDFVKVFQNIIGIKLSL